MCDLSKTKQIVPLGKPVLTIIPTVNFQEEKVEIPSWQRAADRVESFGFAVNRARARH
jgi:hypothetical protein